MYLNYRKSVQFVHMFHSWQRLFIGGDNTEDGMLYTAFASDKNRFSELSNYEW